MYVWGFAPVGAEVDVGTTATAWVAVLVGLIAMIGVGVTDAFAAGAAVASPVAGCVAWLANAVCVEMFSTSCMFEGSPLGIGVEKKLFGSIGVLVTAGGVEYGCSQADSSTATRSRVEAMVKPRFVRDMEFSSISNKSFSDGSITVLTRQVLGWDIGWM